MAPLIRKENDKFILKLNKTLYKKNILDKAVIEDRSWVRILDSKEKYTSLELKTQKLKEVLEWANYLLYLNRAS